MQSPTLTSSVANTSTPRLQYLDTMKVVFTAAVILHHACITYSPIPAWMYLEKPDDTGRALILLIGLNQAFHMPFFFLLSGFFLTNSYDKHGSWKVIRERLIRLGIPLALAWLIIQPASTLWIWTQLTPRPSLWEFWVTGAMSPGVAWYLEVLLALVIVYCVVRAIFEKQGGDTLQTIHTAKNSPPQTPITTLHILAAALLIAFLTFLWRLIVPDRTIWRPLGLPSPSQLPQYIGMFVIGLLAWRRSWFARIPSGAWWKLLLLALIGIGIAWRKPIREAAFGGWNMDAFLTTMGYISFGCLLVAALLVIFRDHINGNGPFRRLLAENAYLAYLLQMPLLVLCGLALRGMYGPSALKALMLTIVGVIACWFFAWLLRKISIVRGIF